MALMDLIDRLPDLMRERRAALGLSQQGLANRLGVNQSTVARWETGEIRPSSTALLRLLNELRSGLDDLVK